MDTRLQVRTNIKKECLTIDTTNITDHLNVKVTVQDGLNINVATSDNLDVSVITYSGLNVNIFTSKPLNIKINTFDNSFEKYIRVDQIKHKVLVNTVILDKLVDVYCYRVCSTNTSHYLNVVPNILWLSPDMFDSAQFDIISNVTWEIN